MKPDDSTPLLNAVAVLGLITSGLAAIYTVIVTMSGFANFSSVRPYITIIVVALGLFTNLHLLRQGRAGKEPKSVVPLLLVSIAITLVIIVPIASAGIDLNAHRGS